MLALKRNTRYTHAHVTYAKRDHNTGARMGFTDSPVAAQTDKPARKDLAQITEARGGGDQELGLRAARNRKGPRRFPMVEAGD